MRALDLLRASTGFLDDLAKSTAMSTYAHLLRDLYDPRPRTEKIADAVWQVAAGMMRADYDEPKLIERTRYKIEESLPLFPLAEIPCDKTLRKLLRARAEEWTARHLTPQVPPQSSFSVENGIVDCSTSRST